MQDKQKNSVWLLWRDRRGALSWLRIITLALLLFPLVKTLVDGAAIAQGVWPFKMLELIHRTGFWSLVLLGLTLSVTPFRHIGRYGQLIDVRRMLGVGAFAYIAAHLFFYITSQSYDITKVVHEITNRTYLLIGFIAWLGLAILAATSADPVMRRLGGLRWRRLHQTVYVIALLSLIHYFQQTKADMTVPIFAASLFSWLIAYRLMAWWMGTHDLSTLSLFTLSVVVSMLTFAGEAIGVSISFHVSPWLVLSTVFDFDVGIRPGWQVLAAGLLVVMIDMVRSRRAHAARRRSRPIAAA